MAVGDQHIGDLIWRDPGLGQALHQHAVGLRPHAGVDQHDAVAGLYQQGIDRQGDVIGRLAGGFQHGRNLDRCLALADDAVVIGHDIGQVAQAPGLELTNVEGRGLRCDLSGISLRAGRQDKSEGSQGDM